MLLQIVHLVLNQILAGCFILVGQEQWATVNVYVFKFLSQIANVQFHQIPVTFIILKILRYNVRQEKRISHFFLKIVNEQPNLEPVETRSTPLIFYSFLQQPYVLWTIHFSNNLHSSKRTMQEFLGRQ